MTRSDAQRRSDRPSPGPLYTDMGADVLMHDSEGATSRLPRYGVWTWDAVKRRHQVEEVGDDLEALRGKYGEGPLVDLPLQKASD
jgi:hypothetical protein